MDNITAKAQDAHSFDGLGIEAKLFSLLQDLQFTKATPIQHQAIPHALEGKDVIGVAQTGTGKTLAFGVPLVQHFLTKKEGKALIMLPTRELALQVEETLQKLGQPFGIKTALLIGGASMRPQMASLKRNPDIVIATPGRLNDHLQQGTIRLHSVSIVVLDEADRMLDMGFWKQIKGIISELSKEKQTLLFSATLSKEIMQLAMEHMKSPISIEVAPPGTTAEKVTQEFFIVPKKDKSRLLEKVLHTYSGPTIIFTRTKHGARKLTTLLQRMGHTATEIHGNRSLSQRTESLKGFKEGKYRVLVATDIASRGIDVKGIELVLNFDLPMQTEDYVHRIGRTARAGTEGHAISFAMPEERREIRAIERLVRMPLRVSQLPELPPARAEDLALLNRHDPEPDNRRRTSFKPTQGKRFGAVAGRGFAHKRSRKERSF